MNHACQRCHKAKATVHITDTMPEKRERHLCEDCAEIEGVIIKQPQTTNAILHEFIKQESQAPQVADVSCPQCNMTFREFQSKGQLGCPADYSVFRKVLSPLIERAHNATHHMGKVPRAAGMSIKKQTDLLRLQRELKEAVEHERYEQAAKLRDEIHNIEAMES